VRTCATETTTVSARGPVIGIGSVTEGIGTTSETEYARESGIGIVSGDTTTSGTRRGIGMIGETTAGGTMITRGVMIGDRDSRICGMPETPALLMRRAVDNAVQACNRSVVA